MNGSTDGSKANYLKKKGGWINREIRWSKI